MTTVSALHVELVLGLSFFLAGAEEDASGNLLLAAEEKDGVKNLLLDTGEIGVGKVLLAGAGDSDGLAKLLNIDSSFSSSSINSLWRLWT